MAANARLSLPEEIMLLVLRDRDGTVAGADRYHYAVGGAVLAELMLQQRVAVETDGKNAKKQYARVVDARPLGDPLLDECLARMAAAKKRARLQTWVSRFANTKRLKHLAAEQLVRRGILRVSEDKVLGIFRRTIYPELDPRPERSLLQRLQKAIFDEGGEVDVRTAILISLAGGADLLGLVFAKKDLKRCKTRIARISNGELVGKATREAIEAMRAAVMVACIMPAIMASSAASH